ncbi:MAG: transcriptional repressor [Paraglaciecola sp.]|uniref:Fur family transcriptional regulator n=1 Tax=Paraglaciecola sp. TaxID=1920173 RepID=UPI0032998EE7
MQNLKQVIAQAEKHCRNNGSRLTLKRQRVLSGLVLSKRALSAYELIDFCKKEFGETLQPMSIYRILEFLKDQELVHKLDLVNKYVACEHINCNYKHLVSQFLICVKCQKVKEIHIEKSVMTGLQRNVEKVGFCLDSPQLEMNCICDACISSQA